MITLYNNLPTLDLHGENSEYAKIMINEFIADNYKLKNEIVVIIHGIGTGIIKKTTQATLKRNKKVDIYKIDNFNEGQTIVYIKKVWNNKMAIYKRISNITQHTFDKLRIMWYNMDTLMVK